MEKYNAMQQAEAFDEYLQSADCESEVIIPATQLEFKIFNNEEHYYNLRAYIMKKQQPLDLSIGLDMDRNWGLPYYIAKIHNAPMKIFITKEIYLQIYDYLKNGVVPDEMPNVEKVYKNQNENFILLHLKVDRKNEATRYNAETKEFKAIYKNGIINYGQLPYTTDELVAKLESLQ